MAAPDERDRDDVSFFDLLLRSQNRRLDNQRATPPLMKEESQAATAADPSSLRRGNRRFSKLSNVPPLRSVCLQFFESGCSSGTERLGNPTNCQREWIVEVDGWLTECGDSAPASLLPSNTEISCKIEEVEPNARAYRHFFRRQGKGSLQNTCV